jgi:hypothetical protein
MSSPRGASAAGSRRRQRSVRVTVAGCLLGIAALAVTAALLVGSLLLTSGAAVLALLCGAAATRIVLNELGQSRREAARDRAAQARAYQQLAREQAAAHGRLAAALTRQVNERDADIGRLVGTLGLVKRRAGAAEEKVKRQSQRNVELQERLDEVTRELEERDDSLAVWEGSDAPTVVDLLAWENRARAVNADPAETRQQA